MPVTAYAELKGMPCQAREEDAASVHVCTGTLRANFRVAPGMGMSGGQARVYRRCYTMP